MLDQITPVVLTLNEEPNISRSLEALRWAHRVVVIDSGSSDATCVIARTFPNVEVITRPFSSHADQWNFGISQATTEWVLALDADYRLTPDLVSEIETLQPPPAVSAYRASFTYVNLGRPLHGSLYPEKPVLFRIGRAHYTQDGHTQRMEVDGEVLGLKRHLLHDDRKALDRWFASQLQYARLEAKKLLTTDAKELSLSDRLRKAILPAPLLAPLFVLFVRGTILDGWPGLHYAFQRGLAELLLSLILTESRFHRDK